MLILTQPQTQDLQHSQLEERNNVLEKTLAVTWKASVCMGRPWFRRGNG